MSIDPVWLDAHIPHWLQIAVIIGFGLFALCLIGAVCWYWPGDDSCPAAQWARYRKRRRR